uniref:Taste receptor type 2 n=1 Tax=Pyxicephalus adspersus TaxID=30357 RepID=A0AAV2ZXC9_PYXAD|nr:TPA: hypothetical protein GDO54_014806 [Pyxicephalus adspersus]
MTPHSVYYLFFGVLGLVLAIPPNTCIVIVNLESIRKKEKLSPSDVIFLAKAIVNILHQCLLTVQGILFGFVPLVFYRGELNPCLNVATCFLVYFSFWLTFWISAHYCTSITNLRNGLFIWVKGVVSNFLSQILFLTVLGVFPVSVLTKWALNIDPQNTTAGASIGHVYYQVILFSILPAHILGCILPFFLTLPCLLLTFSFLVRHVWRVKNNDSGSTRPNLRAHVTALRTIFLLLLMFTFFFMSQVVIFSQKITMFTDPMSKISWTLRSLSPWAEAAVIFQASNKLKSLIGRRFWTRDRRNTDT